MKVKRDLFHSWAGEGAVVGSKAIVLRCDRGGWNVPEDDELAG